MAVSITNITADSNTTSGTSFTTSSKTFTSGRHYLFGFSIRNGASTNPSLPTVTGGGVTWSSVGSTANYDNSGTSRRTLFLFSGQCTSTTTGQLTVDFGAVTHTGMIYSIDEATSHDTSGTIVQSAGNKDTTGTVSTLTVTLAAFGSTNNATYAVFCNGNDSATTTAGTGFAKLGDFSESSANVSGRLTSEWRNDNDTTANITFSLSAQLGGIAVEIKASSGTSYTPTYTETMTLVDTIPRATSRNLSEAITYVDTVLKNPVRILTDVTILVDTIVRAPGKLQSEVMTLVDTYSRVWITYRTLEETTTLVDTLEKNAGRLLSEAITLVDSLVRSVGRFLLEVVTMVDSIIKSISRTLSEVLSLVDVLVRGIFRYLSDFLSMVDTFISELISTSYSAILTETMTLVDNIEKLFNHIISGIPTTLRHLAQIRPFGFLKNRKPSGSLDDVKPEGSSGRGIENGISLKDKNKPSMM